METNLGIVIIKLFEVRKTPREEKEQGEKLKKCCTSMHCKI